MLHTSTAGASTEFNEYWEMDEEVQANEILRQMNSDLSADEKTQHLLKVIAIQQLYVRKMTREATNRLKWILFASVAIIVLLLLHLR